MLNNQSQTANWALSYSQSNNPVFTFHCLSLAPVGGPNYFWLAGTQF